MIAIQNCLNQRHREDREREEERNRDFEFEAQFDPTEPEEQKIDEEEPPLPRSSRPSMEEWREVHRKRRQAPTKKTKPKQKQPHILSCQPTAQTLMETGEPAPNPKPRKPQAQRQQGNPIPIPGQRKEKGMDTDFTPE
ncbi:hypothetical protein DSO57_1005189 [Entomophthora muscae]|uniref:Uncharacterized protein n=1 Tax=Entomophthora muscae TaxID=34485 RepID=A0ACC2SL28_9FUNG|nr:hypothetical protein DSO57_1005189 [Entomophthora muscae]